MKRLFLWCVQGHLTLAVSCNKEVGETVVGLSVNICLPEYAVINLNSRGPLCSSQSIIV